MYVNEDYLNYKYLVSVSDNYIILSNQHSVNADWQNPETYDVIYQYFYPSHYNIETTRTATSSYVFPEIELTSNYWDRPDCCFITTLIFYIVLLLILIVNSITEFVEKGGIIKWIKKNTMVC